jgi:hypothetical protein
MHEMFSFSSKNIDEIFWNENDFLKNEMNFYDNIARKI